MAIVICEGRAEAIRQAVASAISGGRKLSARPDLVATLEQMAREDVATHDELRRVFGTDRDLLWRKPRLLTTKIL